MRRRLCGADIFALPSLWEGLPNAMLEAMAVGLPVTATSVGGVPEVVWPGENGILVPPADPQALADALSMLLDDENTRKRLGEGAKNTARNFSWRAHLDKLETLMETN